MVLHEAEPSLRTFDHRFQTFREFWLLIEPQITKLDGIGAYQAKAVPDGDEVRFRIFGAPGYVRFLQTFKEGWLEYGAIRPGHRAGNAERLPLRRLSFDREGKVEGQWRMKVAAEVESFHREILERLAEALVEIHAGPGPDVDGVDSR